MIVVRTLGTAEIQVGETRILPTAPRKFALLLYLAAERGRPIPRATLQDLIFPDQTEKNGRHSLRELVYQLRHMGLRLTSDAQSVQLDAELVSSDTADLLERAIPTGDQLLRIASGFLPGYAPGHSESFGEWLEAYRARSTFEISKILVNEIGRCRSVSDWMRTELAARACLALDGLNETATLALAEALAMGGAKSQAVDLLDSYNSEVGERARELRLPSTVLRRRIAEQNRDYGESTNLFPFVGREREMRALHDQLELARRGSSRCLTVVGEPGIGKSRLVTEFCQLVALDGVNVASTSAQPHDVHRPFAAFADLLHRLLEFPGSLGISPESMGLLQRLVCSPSFDAFEFQHSIHDGDTYSHAITHAIIDLIDAITSENTLVIAVDDIPSVDAMSLRVFGYLISGSRKRRLLVLATSRGAGDIVGFPTSASATLELGGIGHAAIGRLIESFERRDGVEIDSELSAWVHDASGGHPLLLENLLAHYSQTRERFSIPPSLSSLLAQRMASLSDCAVSALQTCSMLGRFATLETIADATQLARFDLVWAVRELERLHLIRPDGQQIRPTHALVSEVVLQRMTLLERRLSHQFAASALEKRSRVDHSAALVWQCAELWVAAGNSSRAIAAVQQCATHAIEVGRPDAAAQMLARALNLSTSSDERTAVAERLADAADAAMDSHLVLQAVAFLNRGGPKPQHHRLEFAEFKARTRIYFDSPGEDAVLLRCVGDPVATADHRVSAALLLLKYSHSTLSRDLATKTMIALPDSVVREASELIRLEYLVISRVTLNDFETGAQFARQLLSASKHHPTVLRSHLTLNATLALQYAGHVDEVIEVASLGYAETLQTDAPHLSLVFAMILAEHFSDTFDDVRARQWMTTAAKLVEAYPTLSHHPAWQITALSDALARNDVEPLRGLFVEMERTGAFEGGLIRARWRRVASLRIGQLEGQRELTDAELQSLVDDCKYGSLVAGICDAEAALICHALARRARPNEAREFYHSYSNSSRLSRAPIARCLSEALRDVERVPSSVHQPARTRDYAVNVRETESASLRLG